MAILDSSLAERVAEIITRYNMIPRYSRIGVAVSGGADSVVLLFLLSRLRPRFGAELCVLHMNHGLRGAESEADEQFVQSIAQQLALPVLVARSGTLTGNLEDAARKERRSFFLRELREGRLDRVALGHTRTDQAETVLLRLFRGAGLTGLSGMRPVTQEGFIRPLLEIPRGDVREWARAEGIAWREDASNADTRFARNRLRLTVLPALSASFNPQLETLLAETANLAAAEEEYWSLQIEPLFGSIAHASPFGLILDIPTLLAQHVAVRRRLLRRAALKVRGHLRSLDAAHIDAILRVCQSAGAHDRVIVPGLDVLRSYQKLRMLPPEDARRERSYELSLEPGKLYDLPFAAGTIYLELVEQEPSFCVNFKKDRGFSVQVAELDAGALPRQGTAYRLSIRNWEPGDAIRRPGHSAADKIKSLFQEHRVVLWERRHWPVLLAAGEIAWVRQFGVAAKFQPSQPEGPRVRVFYWPPDGEYHPPLNRKEPE
jgi:tRNA(Ile)-lysidine synthase